MGLRIDERQFEALYPALKGQYPKFNFKPPKGISKREFEQKYLTSKLWRLNNLYSIVDKDGNAVIFNMNYSQHRVYAASKEHPRLIVLKSRQQGISTLWLVSYFDDAIFCPDLNLGLMAQGADEAATLLERAKYLWDKLSDDIKAFLNIELHKDNSKEFSFTNKSKIFIRVSFRSATLQRLHISEFGKIANQYPKRARETKTGTLQALGKGNTGIIESTAEGINDFKHMWDKAEIADRSNSLSNKDFKPIFLAWFKDPDCMEPVYQNADQEAEEYFAKLEKSTGHVLSQEQKNFWISQRRELEGDIYQEYPATPAEAFSAAKNGTYWSIMFSELVIEKNRVVTDLYDPNLPVDVFWDLGVDDYTVLLFVQWYRGEYRFIDEYWNDGKAFEHYFDVIEERGYNIRAMRPPHDVEVRSLTNSDGQGNAKSRLVIMREICARRKLQWNVTKVKKTGEADSIAAVRAIIPNLKVDVRCKYTMECIRKFSREWDDKLQVWKNSSRHDEWSHGAATVRYAATGTAEHSNDDNSHTRMPKRYMRNTSFDI